MKRLHNYKKLTTSQLKSSKNQRLTKKSLTLTRETTPWAAYLRRHAKNQRLLMIASRLMIYTLTETLQKWSTTLARPNSTTVLKSWTTHQKKKRLSAKRRRKAAKKTKLKSMMHTWPNWRKKRDLFHFIHHFTMIGVLGFYVFFEFLVFCEFYGFFELY